MGDPSDLITGRGVKETRPFAIATFVGLRALDPFLQHSILAYGTGAALIKALGSSVFAQGPTSNTGYALVDQLNLSPYRLALLAMSIAAAVKQNFWKLAIAEEAMSVGGAAAVGIYNTLFNSLNSLLFICAATSPAFGAGEGPAWEGYPPLNLKVGGVLFAVGIVYETLSEIQRKAFKTKKGNKGLPYTEGLFALSRHPNYAGYTLWRTGFALASGGWTWATAVFAFLSYDFCTRGGPALDKYCQDRYADSWRDYIKRTPYSIFPYIY